MPSPKASFLLGTSAVLAATVVLWPHPAKTPLHAAPPASAAAAPTVQLPVSGGNSAATAAGPRLDVFTALQQGAIHAEWKGNGRDSLMLCAQNLTAQPILLRLAAGQLFASERSTVALLRSRVVKLAPRATHRETLPTVAMSSIGAPREAAFAISSARLTKLDPLFSHFDTHAEISPAAAQTAVLALTENLPLAAFAKFPQLTGGKPPRAEDAALRADTHDIVAALMMLRELRLDARLALTIDPQLKIEAMIDPFARPLALAYYQIQDEWAYWRRELLEGASSTRHYALFGIARFYPDVALQMLPRWARETKTQQVYRVCAVQALAETRRPEAVAILRQLEAEFGAETDLGKSAHVGANFLDAQFSRPRKVVAKLRISKNDVSHRQQPSVEIQTAPWIAAAN